MNEMVKTIKELHSLERSINIAKETLEESYNEINILQSNNEDTAGGAGGGLDMSGIEDGASELDNVNSKLDDTKSRLEELFDIFKDGFKSVFNPEEFKPVIENITKGFVLFAKKFEADISKSEINFNNICQNIHESFSCKKNVEFTGSTLSAISDMWCEVKTENVRFDNNSMEINGIVTAYIIALDNENVPIFYEKSIDFEYKYAMNIQGSKFKCSPEITVKSVNYTINGETSIELRIELNISAAIYECKNTPLILSV